MGVLPCPCCGKPLHAFESRTDARGPGAAVRVLVYVHGDESRCQIRVPLAAAGPAARRDGTPATR